MKDVKKLEKVLKALANTSRLKIVEYLKRHKAGSVGEIADGTTCSYKAVSKHLAILYRVDLLDREQRSDGMYYWIAGDIDYTTQTLIKLI